MIPCKYIDQPHTTIPYVQALRYKEDTLEADRSNVTLEVVPHGRVGVLLERSFVEVFVLLVGNLLRISVGKHLATAIWLYSGNTCRCQSGG